MHNSQESDIIMLEYRYKLHTHAAGMTEEKEWDPRNSFKTKCKWNPCVIQRNLPGRN